MSDFKRPSSLRLPPEFTPARLLIVDNELPLRSNLAQILRLADCTVDETGSAAEGLVLLEKTAYDMLIVDTYLAEMPGPEFLARARQIQPEVVILVLTRRPTLDSAVAAVKAEAVDYLIKPQPLRYVMQVVERGLERRADQLQRRRLVRAISHVLDTVRDGESTPLPPASADRVSSRFVQAASLLLDRQRRLVMIRAEREVVLQLTESETAILANLMSYPDRVLSCRELAYGAWGIDLPEDEAQPMIRPHIFRLRRKLEGVLKTRLIHTLRRKGYYFSAKEI